MGGLFPTPKGPVSLVKQPIPPPEPVPEVMEETEEEAAKRARRRRGYARTILTGALTPTPTGRKTVLG